MGDCIFQLHCPLASTQAESMGGTGRRRRVGGGEKPGSSSPSLFCFEWFLWQQLLLFHDFSCCQIVPSFLVSASARNPPSVLLTSLWWSYLLGSDNTAFSLRLSSPGERGSMEVNGFWLLLMFGLPSPSYFTPWFWFFQCYRHMYNEFLY